jgi:hypothetical protein
MMKILEPLIKKYYELCGIPKKMLEGKIEKDVKGLVGKEMDVWNPLPSKNKEEPVKPVDKRYKNFHQFFGVEEEQEVNSNTITLAELKKFSNRDWMEYTKQQCKDLLDSIGVDHSNIVDEKWEYVRFIKDVIKSNNI